MENCKSFKSFGSVYIYIYIYRLYVKFLHMLDDQEHSGFNFFFYYYCLKLPSIMKDKDEVSTY